LPNIPLMERVWCVRILTGLVASLVVPIGYFLARDIFGSKPLALSLVAIVAVTPGVAFASSRVSNEGLSIPAFSLLLLAAIEWVRQPRRWLASAVGALLGIGLLTKAYFLTAVPALILLYVWCGKRSRRYKDLLVQASITLGIALAISGWWYVRNYIQTGTLSGLDEAVMLRNMGMLEEIWKALGVNWVQAIAIIVSSHIWYGGWSLLALPKWIYFLGFGVFGASMYGIAKMLMRSRTPQVLLLLDFYTLFWMGQLYHIAMLFLSKGSSTAMGGWYLYSVIWAEVTLGIAGCLELIGVKYRQHVVAALLIGVAAIDIYGIHAVSIPYYVQAGVTLDLSRLLVNKPGFIGMNGLFLLWVGYTLSTSIIVIVGIASMRKLDSDQPAGSVPAGNPHCILRHNA